MLEIDDTAHVSPLADIEPSVRDSRISIGANCVVDSFVKIKPAGGSGDLTIGAKSVINSGCVLYTGHGIVIGENCLIAANCTFSATNHAFSDPKTAIRDQGFQPSRGGIVLEDDVWVGANSVILDGAHLAHGCVVAAGSVVRQRLKPLTIYAGNPLREIGTRQ